MTMPLASNGSPSSASSISVSPPSPRSTSAKAVAPSSTAKMNAVVRVVSCSTSRITRASSWRFTSASSNAPKAPTPAASVGVATPMKILPSTARIRKAGGRMAWNNAPMAAQSTGA